MLSRLLGWLCVGFILGACATQTTNTPIPTLTLVPPTVTPTATPIIPTITPQNLPSAQELSLSPSPIPLMPLIPSVVNFDNEIVEQTRLNLANNLGLSLEQIQLIRIQSRLYYSVECSTGFSPLPSALSHGLEIVWIANEQTHTYLTWGDDNFVWCNIDRIHGEILTAIDPIAAELTALAIRRVQQQTDLSSEDVVVEVVSPIQWQDSSLGCPQPNQVYSDIQIDGYRIIISDGENSYLFHTDSVQLIPCEFDQATN